MGGRGAREAARGWGLSPREEKRRYEARGLRARRSGRRPTTRTRGRGPDDERSRARGTRATIQDESQHKENSLGRATRPRVRPFIRPPDRRPGRSFGACPCASVGPSVRPPGRFRPAARPSVRPSVPAGARRTPLRSPLSSEGVVEPCKKMRPDPSARPSVHPSVRPVSPGQAPSGLGVGWWGVKLLALPFDWCRGFGLCRGSLVWGASRPSRLR